MRILLLNYEFPPMGGGAGRATYNIAKELTRQGNEVHVLTSKFKSEKSFEIKDNVTIHRVISWRKSIHDCGFMGALVYAVFAYFKMRRLVKSQSFDILHYFFGLPTGLMAILPGRHRRIPYIVSLRGSDVPHYDPFNRTLQIAHQVFKPITKKIWRNARKVVALSDSLKNTALITSPNQKIEIIGNGIDTQLFAPGLKTGENHTLKFITVSRLIERKGIQHVLKALHEMPDAGISLTIVGEGSYKSHLQHLCDQYELNAVVNIVGYWPNEELGSLYNLYDVFILTSLAESFGIVFLEAMACGLPIIGAITGEIPNIVSEDNGLLVEPGNVEQIKAAICTMRDDPELRLGMSRRNREKVIRHYSWKSVAVKYKSLYQIALNQNR